MATGDQNSKAEEASNTPIRKVRRILVADDNEDAADGLAIFLRHAGYAVEVVYNGLAAWQAAQRTKPEIIFLDIGMLGLSGHEVARRIRAQAWGKEILLIAQTGWGHEDDVRRSREAGFDLHITKPPDFDTLEKLLSDSLPVSPPRK